MLSKRVIAVARGRALSGQRAAQAAALSTAW